MFYEFRPLEQLDLLLRHQLSEGPATRKDAKIILDWWVFD